MEQHRRTKRPRVSAAKTVPLAMIHRDGGTQSRAQLDDATVTEYTEHLAELPPVTVYHDGEAYWLADGFHRVAAHERVGAAEAPCEVIEGPRDDAVLHAAGANATHGLRRSNADKRRAVDLLLRHPQWSKRSDRWIAQQCRVSHPFVRKVRQEAQVPIGNVSNAPARQTQDGREYPAHRTASREDSPEVRQCADMLGFLSDDDWAVVIMMHARSHPVPPKALAFAASIVDPEYLASIEKQWKARKRLSAAQRESEIAEHFGSRFRLENYVGPQQNA